MTALLPPTDEADVSRLRVALFTLESRMAQMEAAIVALQAANAAHARRYEDLVLSLIRRLNVQEREGAA